MDDKEKYSKIVVFYLAKSFTERLEANPFHKGVIFLLSSMLFRRFSIGSSRKLQSKYSKTL